MSSELTDHNATITFFKTEVDNFVKARGWLKYHTPKNVIQALNIEVAELSELFLFKEESVEDILNNSDSLSSITQEVADIFIYLISFINTLGLDLTEAFTSKMELNKRKYSLDKYNNGYYEKK